MLENFLDIRKIAFRKDMVRNSADREAWENEFKGNMISLAEKAIVDHVKKASLDADGITARLYKTLAKRRMEYAVERQQEGRYGYLRTPDLPQWTYEPYWFEEAKPESAPAWSENTKNKLQEFVERRKDDKKTQLIEFFMEKRKDDFLNVIKGEKDDKIKYTNNVYIPQCPKQEEFFNAIYHENYQNLPLMVDNIFSSPWDRDFIEFFSSMNKTTQSRITIIPMELSEKDFLGIEIPRNVLPICLSAHVFLEKTENGKNIPVGNFFLYANLIIDSDKKRDRDLLTLCDALILKVLSLKEETPMDREEIIANIAKLTYLYAHILPVYRGNAAISESIIGGLSRYLGLKGFISYSDTDDGWDVTAFRMSMQEFVDWAKDKINIELPFEKKEEALPRKEPASFSSKRKKASEKDKDKDISPIKPSANP